MQILEVPSKFVSLSLFSLRLYSPCVIVSKIRPQPLKTPREQPSTFSAVILPSKDKPALKRRTGRERASKNLHFPFWDFYISRGQQSVFAAFIRNSPHPWGGLLRGQASSQTPASEEKLYISASVEKVYTRSQIRQRGIAPPKWSLSSLQDNTDRT